MIDRLIAFAAVTAALTSVQNSDAAIIQLTPTGTTVIDTFYIDFSSNSSAQHFFELDEYFVPADLVETAASGQNNTNPNQLPIDTTGWQYMVVRYEQNGPAGDLIGAFDLNGVTSIDLAILDGTVPTGYDHHQAFLYNADVVTTETPDGGATAALLGLGALALGIVRKSSK